MPEAASYYSLEASTITWKFPEPGYLEGVKTKDKAILKMTSMNFGYPGAEKKILNDVNVQVRFVLIENIHFGQIVARPGYMHVCISSRDCCRVRISCGLQHEAFK